MQALITLIDIPAQKAVMGSSFTPTLGQYGVGIREFCNIFNNKTKDFCEDLPFNLSISVQSREKFNISKLKINPNFITTYYSPEPRYLSTSYSSYSSAFFHFIKLLKKYFFNNNQVLQ